VTLGEPKERVSSKRLTMAGFAASVAYLCSIAWYWLDQSSSVINLKPNEFGDFLAGVFAPLAFLWLVLGFIQQGIELRNSAQALWLQGEELRNSVEQQRELVQVTQDQLALEKDVLAEQRNEIERNSQPIFEISPIGSHYVEKDQSTYNFSISNHGKTCTDVRIFWVEFGNVVRIGALEAGGFYHFHRVMDLASNERFHWVVSYIDLRSQQKTIKFEVVKQRSEFTINELDDSKGQSQHS
jgi:hypothetical protein